MFKGFCFALGSGIWHCLPRGDLVSNPHCGFCSKHLAQWDEVFGERTSKS